MSFSLTSLFQAPKRKVLSRVLELIPYTVSVLDPKLLGLMQEITELPADYVVLLLEFLSEHDYVEIESISPVSATGKIYFIKRIK